MDEEIRKRKKRAVRRGRGEAMRVGTDLWLLICMHMHANPHAVFRLMMANKSIYAAIRSAPDAWWLQLLGRVTAYQNGLRHSNYACHLRSLTRAHLQSHDQLFNDGGGRWCEGLLRAVFAPRCCCCGARQGHRLLRPFALRVCHACLRANAVSNATLALRYGVHFCDFAEAYVAAGGLLLPIDAFSHPPSALNCLSSEACDMRYLSERQVKTGMLFFLWRPHIERIGIALRHTERGAATQAIWACMQRAMRQNDIRRRALLRYAIFDGGAAYRRYIASSSNSTPPPVVMTMPGGPFDAPGVPRYDAARMRRLNTVFRGAYCRLKGFDIKGRAWFPSLPQTPSGCI